MQTPALPDHSRSELLVYPSEHPPSGIEVLDRICLTHGIDGRHSVIVRIPCQGEDREQGRQILLDGNGSTDQSTQAQHIVCSWWILTSLVQ